MKLTTFSVRVNNFQRLRQGAHLPFEFICSCVTLGGYRIKTTSFWSESFRNTGWTCCSVHGQNYQYNYSKNVLKTLFK